MDNNFLTLLDTMRYRVLHQPHQTGFTFLQDGEIEVASLTYQELDRQARAIAVQLQSLCPTGERVLLLYPSGLEFIAAFLGCLYAGIVAVPAYPPRPNHSLSRLQAIATDAQAKIALTTTNVLLNVEQQLNQFPELKALHWLPTDNIGTDSAQAWREPEINGDTLAFLQYTSGSTGTPKGVMVSHKNLLYNELMIQQAMGHTEKTVFVGWLPLFHDMGLIGNVLQPLYLGIPCILMSPTAFLQKPIRWLQAISKYRATTSGGPNFAYDLCVRKITPEQRATLDLSSWEVAFNGSEPVRAETLKQFTNTFEPQGFSRKAFYACYGMAETTLLVSGASKTALPVLKTFAKDALEQNRVVSASGEDDTVRTLVGCGQTWLNQQIIIVNPETLTSCKPNQVGEIWVSGSNVAQGYWRKSEVTEHSFQAKLQDTGEGPFLRTGDLGFLQDGELFVTGRLKDIIIIRGRNHYPHDIELTAQQSHSSLKPDSSAAFTIEVDGEEKLVIACEVERTHLRKLNVDEVVLAVRRAVSQHHELQVHAVALLKPGGIPKTSSGKIQRRACRSGFLDNTLSVVNIEKAKSQNGSTASGLNSSLHNSLYRAARVEPLPIRISSTYQSSKPEAVSKKRADDMIRWIRNYANERINSRLIDERRCIPPYIVLDLGNKGFLGMQVPEQYGGMNLSYHDTLRVFEQLAAIDLSLASFIGVHHALGTRPIMKYARASVRDQLLPSIARGVELGAFAITEPCAGSDPRAIATTAVPDSTGGWRLRGQKVWIGTGSWAGAINVFAQLLDANHQPVGISAFVVRQGTKGLRQGAEALTMGMRGMVQNSVHFEDVLVSPENLLGELASGMEVAQDAMMCGRLIVGTCCIGGMKRCAQLMLRYAENRSISTGCLLDNPLTLARFSELTAAIVALESLVFRIARLLDNGSFVPAEIYAACKIAGPEFFWKAADNLMQLLGGRGYIETNIAPQLLRDARLLRIFEGPTETLTMFLGSRVLNQSEELHQFLCQSLGAPAVSQRLKAAAEQIHERCIGPKTPFSDRASAIRWASTLIGEVATFAILLAAVQGAFEFSGSERLRRAVEWAQLHFEQQLEKALSGTPAESVLPEADDIKRMVSAYTDNIGDLEQTLAGEDRELDELLRQNPAQTNSPKIQFEYQPTIISKTPPQPVAPNKASSAQPVRVQSSESLQDWMVNWLVKKLKIEAKSVEPSQAFADFGIDSMLAVELSQDLSELLHLSLEATILWKFPTIESLAQHLVSELSTSSSTDLVNSQQQSFSSNHQIQSQNGHEQNGTIEMTSEDEIAQLLAQEIAVVKSRKLK